RRAIQHGVPDLPQSLGPHLRSVAAACLAKDPAKRPSAPDLAEMLRPRQRKAVPGPVVVAQDGSGDYNTIGDALKSLTSRESPRVIVRAGTYTEALTLERTIEIV